MRLKFLASVIFIAILSYSLFWYYMAGELEDRIEYWVSAQKSRGVNIRYDDLEITGFPYRMELTLNKLKVIKTGRRKMPILYRSPHIKMVAFPWKINHGVIVSDGGELRIGNRRYPALIMDIGKFRSSVEIDFPSLKFKRASLIIEELSWSSGRNGPSRAEQVKLHILRPNQLVDSDKMELPVQLKLYLEAKDIIAREIPVGIFGKKADQLKIDLQIHGEKLPTYSKDSLATWRDQGGTLRVSNFEVTSGEMDMDLDGEVALDQDMMPLGAFAAKIHGIDHMVGILSKHSAFKMEPGNMILQELDRMNKVGENGNKKTLDLAISLQGGLLFLGPIPVMELNPVVE